LDNYDLVAAQTILELSSESYAFTGQCNILLLGPNLACVSYFLADEDMRLRIDSEREFSLSIPPHTAPGTEVTLSLEDIGLKDVNLCVLIQVDPSLE